MSDEEDTPRKRLYWQMWRQTVSTQLQALASVAGLTITALSIVAAFSDGPFSIWDKRILFGAIVALALQITLLIWEAHNERRAAFMYVESRGKSVDRICLSKFNNVIHPWTNLLTIASWVLVLILIWLRFS